MSKICKRKFYYELFFVLYMKTLKNDHYSSKSIWKNLTKGLFYILTNDEWIYFFFCTEWKIVLRSVKLKIKVSSVFLLCCSILKSIYNVNDFEVRGWVCTCRAHLPTIKILTLLLIEYYFFDKFWNHLIHIDGGMEVVLCYASKRFGVCIKKLY